MASHRILLSEPFTGRRIGMGTTADFDGREIRVKWGWWTQVYPAKIGDYVLISCQGRIPSVVAMTPPADPVARAAWKRGFYAKKRHATAETLREAASKLERYSAPHGCSIGAARIYETQNCVIVYRAAMDGQIGVPWGWYAGPEATPEELAELIEYALSR